MLALSKLFHIAAAVLWLGGVGFMMFALRPAAALLQPAQRLPFLAAALGRFFVVVWCAIAVLLLTGIDMLLGAGVKGAPIGWHLMAGIGILMCLLFGHLYYGPFRRLKNAIGQADWMEAGQRMGQIATLATLNFALGWLAIAAVILVK